MLWMESWQKGKNLGYCNKSHLEIPWVINFQVCWLSFAQKNAVVLTAGNGSVDICVGAFVQGKRAMF